jgi:hypothetical protein
MPPENMNPTQAWAWANVRLKFIASYEDLVDLCRSAEQYSLGLYTRKKTLPVGGFSLSPSGSIQYLIDDEKPVTSSLAKLHVDLSFQPS